MNRAIRDRWTAAMRSDQYPQGWKNLNKDGKFCCLGVLCDLYAQDSEVEWEETSSGKMQMHGEVGFLPKEVIKWAGLKYTAPDLLYKEESLSLVRLNDIEGLSFNQIADLVEQQL